MHFRLKHFVLLLSLLPVGLSFAASKKAKKKRVVAKPLALYEAGQKGLAFSAQGKNYFPGTPVEIDAAFTFSIDFQMKNDGERLCIFSTPKSDGELIIDVERSSISVNIGSINKEFLLPLSSPRDWHSLTITFGTEGPLGFYIDGKLVKSENIKDLGTVNFKSYVFGVEMPKPRRFARPFNGLIDNFFLYDRQLDSSEITNLAKGVFIRRGLLTFNDFENVDHRAQAKPGDSDALDEGRRLYETKGACFACHGKDGLKPPNPLARSFTRDGFLNGEDPYAMFRTLTYGFKNMMPSLQLNPEERYLVIHYIREKVIKVKAQKFYSKINENDLEIFPTLPGEKVGGGSALEQRMAKGYYRDRGAALGSAIAVGKGGNKEITCKNALTIDLGHETTISYSLLNLGLVDAWEGGFLYLKDTQHYQLRGERIPTISGKVIPGMKGWRWAWKGKAENQVRGEKGDGAGPHKKIQSQLDYRGYHVHGRQIVLDYSIEGRKILESPALSIVRGRKVIHHRMTIGAGSTPLELVVGRPPDKNWTSAIKKDGPVIKSKNNKLSFSVTGDQKNLKWRITRAGEPVLKIPALKRTINVDVQISFSETEKKNDRPLTPARDMSIDLSTLTKGGPRRWAEEITTRGHLEQHQFQGYAVDSLGIPIKNKYKSWMRTSDIAFFPDGRMAVSTYGGDVWIVSGIDKNLKNLRWKRYAAGIYQPMGIKVIDGIITLTTRGRLVKLHDRNNDGEADYYEAFYNEPEPSGWWHGFNFGLTEGKDKSLYYCKAGEFTSWSTPGAVIKISATGQFQKFMGKGLRAPNGIGMLPDGRITMGDNQGRYIPASKIAIMEPGTFHGGGYWDKTEEFKGRTKMDEPMIWMPQELDSSSGGQLWIDDERFGPLSKQFFHTSYGRAKAMLIYVDKLKKLTQASAWPLPLKFDSGLMRLAKNPMDGQLYLSGLTGWQAGANKEGGIQRLRFTGKQGLYLLDAKARKGQLRLRFNRPVRARDRGKKFEAEMWNYKWTSRYGSPEYKVRTSKEQEGRDNLEIKGTHLEDDGKTLVIETRGMMPCNTLKLDFEVTSGDFRLTGPLYFTIHQITEVPN